MFKTFKYRIYPKESQKVLLAKHFGCVRFVYNLGLETKQTAYAGYNINISCFDLMNQLKSLKEVAPFLKEVNSQSLQMALRNLENSYTNFFKGKANFPKFKKKNNKDSFHCTQRVSIKNNEVFLPKFKNGIKLVIDRPHKGQIKIITISKTPTDKYYASVLCDTGEALPQKNKVSKQTTVGVDLGLKTFLVTSDGQKFDNPRFLKNSMLKLKFIQRNYSKHKGKRTRKRLALLHEKVANQRKDFLHKVSTQLVRDNQSVAVEDLNVIGMMQNSCLAQAVSDVGWSELIRQVGYKTEWQGKNLLQIGRFDPSSKMCSCCGWIKKDMTLDDREWTCQKCLTRHDRDENAAKNVKTFALRNHVCGTQTQTQNELPTLVGVLTSEAHVGLSI